MPRIMPDERYFSMPSAEVGGDVRENRALNCRIPSQRKSLELAAAVLLDGSRQGQMEDRPVRSSW
jgi:hypothetical protein